MLYADACDVGEKIVSENWPLVYQSCVKKYPDPSEILHIHIYRESSKADRSNILFHIQLFYISPPPSLFQATFLETSLNLSRRI